MEQKVAELKAKLEAEGEVDKQSENRIQAVTTMAKNIIACYKRGKFDENSILNAKKVKKEDFKDINDYIEETENCRLIRKQEVESKIKKD